jgi:hypothetical protein
MLSTKLDHLNISLYSKRPYHRPNFLWEMTELFELFDRIGRWQLLCMHLEMIRGGLSSVYISDNWNG